MEFIVAKKQIYDLIHAYIGDGYHFVNTDVLKEGGFEIETHPDVHLCQLKGKTIVSPRLYHEILSSASLTRQNDRTENLICGLENPCGGYPNDVLYNIVYLGNCLFANKMDERIQHKLNEGIKWVQVKQGYVKCSTLVVCAGPQPAVITEDQNLARVYAEHGVDVLKIEKGYVELEGFEYGFIGGASATLEDTIYFFGSLSNHPDANRIQNFIKGYSKKIVELPLDHLTDLGGAFLIS